MSAVITIATLPTATAAAFASTVGSVHGCTLTRLTLVSRDRRKDPRPLVSADVAGWSPTLHRVTMDWHTVLPVEWTLARITSEPLGFAEALRRLFAAKIAIQAARAAAGVLIDTAFPLQSTYEHNLRVGHLHVDRGVLALGLVGRHARLQQIIAGASGTPLTTLLAPHLKDLHYSTPKYRGGPKLVNGIEKGMETQIGGDVIRTVSMRANHKGGVIMADGFLQIVDRQLPDSLMAAMPGRRIGEAVAIHPALDGRIVLEAGTCMTHSRPTLWFQLEPDPVALAPLVGQTSREAMVELLVADAPS